MKSLLTLGTLALALFVSSCDKSDDDDNVSAQDRNFVSQMSLSNRTEIALGNLAASKATNDTVRMYAQMMVMEHTTADSTLGILASNLGITAPADSLDPTAATLRTSLMGLSGRAFDSLYISSQVTGHQMSLNIAQTEVASGTNGQLRGFAGDMTPKIQAHLAQAEVIAAQFK